MSEKFSARNSCMASPLRGNTFTQRGANLGKTIASKRNGTKKADKNDKIAEDRKNEGKDNREGAREEFGKTPLNLTLVGSPAPRSQVRALVSSSNLAAKSRIKPSHGSKLREQNPHEMCMEKLYQFADNPTKFVRLENREEPELQLDLEFSDRSEESENFYNSHNIAFGENGEYRIPEYDHIRFLQFSIGDNLDPPVNEDQHNTLASGKSSSSPVNGETICNGLAKGDEISTIPDSPESRRSLDSPEAVIRVDEINPWNNSKIISHGSNWAKNDITQSYPLGSAINYKNTINPEVERFMLLDTGLGSEDGNYAKSTVNNSRLIDESILSKTFTQAIRLQPFEGSVENSSRTSPVTSRTTLSQASSADGTWHGHSLNSPYFASMESNSRTDSRIPGYEETEEYLTIVKNERDSSSENGAQRYIFITDQFLGSELHGDKNSDDENDGRRDKGEVDESITRLSKTEFNSSAEIERLASSDSRRHDSVNELDISNADSSSEYCIGTIFSRSSRVATSSSSSSSSSSSFFSSSSAPSFSSPSVSEKTKASGDEEDNINETKRSVCEVDNSNLLEESSSSQNVLYMTLEEVTRAADYTSKLSEIFNRALKRSGNESIVKTSEKVSKNSNSTCLTPQNTPKLISSCLASPNFHTSHLSP